MKRLILATLFATSLLAPVSSQADHVTRLIDHAQVSFTASDPGKVHDVIVDVGRKHGWKASNEVPGQLRLSNTIRGTFEVVVDVKYSGSSMQVDYVSSTNLYYRLKHDVPYIHPKYNKWVNLLLVDSQARLSH